MLKMVDGTGIIGVDMVCPLGGTVSPPQPPNFDKVEMEGVGSLMLPNSLEAPVERVELIGNSVQPTTTGKNLFDPKQLQGISGFTIEGNEITQSGYNVSTGKTLKQLCPEITPGTYILSANNGEFTGLFGITKPMYKKSAIEIVEEDLNRIVSLVGNPNKTIKYTLQIEKGNTVTPYEPYTGGKPSPSPEYQQEIKSAGRKSKNLFDITKLKKGAGANYPTEIELVGETLIAKKDGGTANQMTFEIELENLEPNTTYEFTTKQIICKRKDSDTEKAGTIFSFRAYKNENQIENKGNVFTTGESESDIYKILFSVIDGDFGSLEYVKFEQPMLSHSGGSYEPYSGKYKIDIKVTEKNLFDREKARDTSNWIIRDGDGYAKFPIRVGKGNKATFSYTEKLTPGKGFYLGIAQSDTGSAVGWLHHSTEINLNNNKFTVVAKGDCLYLSCNKTSIQKFFDTIQTLQVEMGSEPTPYEPYTEQTLTLTSDRPITKWDKLVEQGGSMGWLYSGKIAKEFTFVSKASDENISGRIRRRFKTSLNGKFPQTDKVMCNFLTTDNVRNDYSIGIVGSGDIYIYFYENTGVETLEQANHWLKNLPFEKTIIFERKTTEFVPLSESEQTQLRNLHSYNGTTNITVDSGEVPCGIKLTYRKEK